jgi:aldose 1-epimerase
MHGVPWSILQWDVVAFTKNKITAQLDWKRPDFLAVFPFPHRVEFSANIDANGLTIETAVIADSGCKVPVSFGFHPYFGISGIPRAQWTLQLPPLQKIILDKSGIPTGQTLPYEGFDSKLGNIAFDDGFSLKEESISLSLSGEGMAVLLEFIEGYRCLQVYAPADKDYVALEPMTGPTNALKSGMGLRLVESGGTFRASFRISVKA